jgi:hypothetical protein|tara:strand:+ start:303 stop:494 length:192 start_codon:yes stop_codon:yes gene_type:complete
MPNISLEVHKNELGLFQADVLLTLPPIAVQAMKADRDDLEYELRNQYSEIVGEIVSKLIKDEF